MAAGLASVERVWDLLPEALLQKIISAVLDNDSKWLGRKDLFAISSVCHAWRMAAQDVMFEGMWKSSPLICHPAQLFALSPVPVKGGLVKCCIRRENISEGLGPPQHKFSLHLWSSQKQVPGKFLLSAVQSSRHAKILHLLKTDRSMPCAKLLSNLWGSHYRLAKLHGYCTFSSYPASVGAMDLNPSTALGLIKYKLRMKGIVRPRRLAAWLPDFKSLQSTNSNENRLGANTIDQGILPSIPQEKWQHHNSNEQEFSHSGALIIPSEQGRETPWNCDMFKSSSIKLVNKLPLWNDGLKCWCLNFRGRVKLASVKNFQLMSRNDANGRIVMQFGKVDTNFFVMDYNPTVISAVQAFGIALTSFDSGIRL